MTCTVDTNILVHASNRDSARYGPAHEFLRGLGRGPGLVTIFWPVLMGYVRIVTSNRILAAPLSAEDANTNVERLLGRPHPCRWRV